MTGVPAAPEEAAMAFTDRLVGRVGESLESVVFSPYPFSGGQILVVCRAQVRYLHELMVAAHRSGPPEMPTHWLRPSELRYLSLPQLVDWPRYPAWSYWLRHRGRVLWGSDVRERVPLPESPRRMLEGALVGSMTWDRNHVVLKQLAAEKYAELAASLVDVAHHFMATALLLRGEWEIEEKTVPERFARAFRADGAEELCRGLEAASSGSAEAARENAFEAVWLVERLYRQLRRHVE